MSDVWLTDEDGPAQRADGGGGGARGGGSLLELALEYRCGCGVDDNIASRDPMESMPWCDAREPSELEGVTSERKERSLADNARVLPFSCSVVAAAADGFRENLLKNRETADGCVADPSPVLESGSAVAAGETGVAAAVGDAIRDDAAVAETSMLAYADADGDVGLTSVVGDFGWIETGGSVGGLVVLGFEFAFLPQKDNKLLPFLSLAAGSDFSSDSCLRSQPHSS